MRIAVIDGQGGGIGKSVIDKIRVTFSEQASIIALGTNSIATSAMIKAGADEGATGENAIIYNVPKCDVIIELLGSWLQIHSTASLVRRWHKPIAESDAIKILIPINKCNLLIAGSKESMLSDYIEDMLNLLIKFRQDNNV